MPRKPKFNPKLKSLVKAKNKVVPDEDDYVFEDSSDDEPEQLSTELMKARQDPADEKVEEKKVEKVDKPKGIKISKLVEDIEFIKQVMMEKQKLADERKKEKEAKQKEKLTKAEERKKQLAEQRKQEREELRQMLIKSRAELEKEALQSAVKLTTNNMRQTRVAKLDFGP